jgi:hypothetical protein
MPFKNMPHCLLERPFILDVVQPQVTFLVTFSVCHLGLFYRIVVKIFENRYNLVLIRHVKFLESEELANSSWDDETSF